MGEILRIRRTSETGTTVMLEGAERSLRLAFLSRAGAGWLAAFAQAAFLDLRARK